MKRILSALLVALSSLGVFAQEALWSVPHVISPEINPDRTVTFRVKAPEARQVGVVGWFNPNGYAEFVKGEDGTWSFTSAPLDPELYIYNLKVDGLTIVDPSNAYTIRDVSTIFNYFIVPGDKSEPYMVGNVPHGTVSKVWYDSPALGMKRRMTVYTPAGYDRNSERYPVLYLLHGMGGDEEAWMTLGRTSQILDNLIAAGKVKPMIVVMPNGNVDMEAAPGENHYGLAQPTTALPKTMEGTYESSFKDIVNFVDKTYRTKADKAHRAIAGLSMGGFHSCHISKLYPDLFDYVGLFSAAINPRGNKDSYVYTDVEGKLKAQFAEKPKLYWIAIGNQDFLYKDNEEFRKLLDAGNYPYEYLETEGGHTWSNWRDYLVRFTQRLF